MLGIEHDAQRVAALEQDGFNVLRGDATDGDLWRRLRSVPTLGKVILAMPYHDANLLALRVVQAQHFGGRIAAVCQWPEQIAELHDAGADEVLYLYTGAGAALADAAMGEQAILRAMEREERAAQAKG